MAKSGAGSTLSEEYDNFLFANIGEQESGAPLSMASALVRLELDPWDEAARLTKMPAAAATAALTLILASLPDLTAVAEIPKLSARLVALLPKRSIEIAQAAKALGASSRQFEPRWKGTLLAVGRINPNWSWGVLLLVLAFLAWRLF